MNTESSISETAPKEWVLNIKKLLEEKEAESTPVCILKVPKKLKDIKEDNYSPRLIGLGPYHHMRPDLYEMQIYKLIAAKKVADQNAEQAIQTLENLATGLNEDCIAQIRSCYDRYLNFSGDQLAWIMVTDAIFLLKFLQVVVKEDRDSYLCRHKRMSHLVDPTQTAYHSTLKDIMMLENQIPTVVLNHVKTITLDHGSLLELLLATCKKLSPFQQHVNTCFDNNGMPMPSHLLELLYFMIVPKGSDLSMQEDDSPPIVYEDQVSQDVGGEGKDFVSPDNINTGCLENMLGNINPHAILLKPVKLIIQLAKYALPSLSSVSRKTQTQSSHSESSYLGEIKIPSASDLVKVGVKFCPTDAPFPTCISFNPKKKELHLPVITIDGNTEVIMRNLVAFEAAAIQGVLVLARYTELMKGIIDDEKDVKLLIENRVIVKAILKTDKEVCNMWNSMCRSICLSRVPCIDKAINEVNKYYANKNRVRFLRFTKECMFRGWKILMLFFVLLLLALMIIQSFCDVYRCSRVVGVIYRSGSQNGSR